MIHYQLEFKSQNDWDKIWKHVLGVGKIEWAKRYVTNDTNQTKLQASVLFEKNIWTENNKFTNL